MPLNKIHLYSNKPGELDSNSNIQYVYIFSAIAVFILLIACVNFMNLSTARSANRAREIGIRKVLGATILSIISLLSKDFIKLVMLAVLIASPIAYWAMHQWLEDFAYRVTISWEVFVLSGSAGLLIALITAACQAFRSALANPVQSLRSE